MKQVSLLEEMVQKGLMNKEQAKKVLEKSRQTLKNKG